MSAALGLVLPIQPHASPIIPPGMRKIFVNASAGTSADYLARSVAQDLEHRLDGKYLVENLQGSAGTSAALHLKHSEADGRHLLLANSGMICNTPLLLGSKSEFNPVSDFAPICILCKAPFLLVAHKALEIRSIEAIKRYAKGQNKRISYATTTIGSAGHIGGEVLFGRLGIAAEAIPYSKSSQAIIDIIAGQIPLGIFSWQAVAGAIEGDRISAISILSDQRLEISPNIPSLREQGHENFGVIGWQGLFMRREVSENIIKIYADAMTRFSTSRDFKEILKNSGYTEGFQNQVQASKFIPTEIDRYKHLLQEARIIS